MYPYYGQNQAYPYGYESPDQRLLRMQQELQRYQQPPQPPPQNSQVSSLIYVGSEDEARQHPLDFNGGAQVFFDRQTQKIYMKQINTGTGLLDFDTYDKTATMDAIQAPDRFEVLLSEIKLLREDVQNVRDDFKRLSSKGSSRQDPKHGKPKPGQRD